MKFITSRYLDRLPANLSSCADSVILVTVREEATFLEAYDPHLAPLWSKRLEHRAIALLTMDRKPWILDSEGAWACGESGDCLIRVSVPAREGMRLSALGLVDDGFVFAWEHGIHMPMRPPILERVSSNGAIRWSVALPVASVRHEGVVQVRASEEWKPRPSDPWLPETWLSTSRTLPVSGDAVLACFSEMPRSGIGLGYVVSLIDGALRFTTQTGPISEVASLGGGGFLIGYQGYGAFETLRYDRDGRVAERWASHGYYVVGNGIRVIELENRVPSEMHLVRLLEGGAMTKGAWLDGYYTSRPLVSEDGTAYFFRKGAVVAARDVSIDERLVLAASDDGLFSTAITAGEQGFYLAYQDRSGRAGASLVRIDL